MEATVLVLDVAQNPIDCVPWQRAIVWWLDRNVEIVEEDPERYIRTVGWSVKLPSVVRQLRPIPISKAVKFSRRNIYLRDKGRCQYCGLRVAVDDWEYEHVVPRRLGGRTTWDNIVVACTSCNQQKGGRTPQQAGMQLRTKPTKPRSLPISKTEVQYNPSMPSNWQKYLRDAVYWNSALEE